MNPIPKVFKTVRGYISVLEEKNLINEELERLNHMQRQITIKNAIAGNPDGAELAELSKPEQLKLLKGILIEKLRLGVSAEEVMQAIRLLEDKPPFCYQEQRTIEYKIPILSELGAFFGWGVVAIAAMGVITLAKLDPAICKPSEGLVNDSQFCQSKQAFARFFYNYKEVK